MIAIPGVRDGLPGVPRYATWKVERRFSGEGLTLAELVER